MKYNIALRHWTKNLSYFQTSFIHKTITITSLHWRESASSIQYFIVQSNDLFHFDHPG